MCEGIPDCVLTEGQCRAAPGRGDPVQILGSSGGLGEGTWRGCFPGRAEGPLGTRGGTDRGPQIPRRKQKTTRIGRGSREQQRPPWACIRGEVVALGLAEPRGERSFQARRRDVVVQGRACLLWPGDQLGLPNTWLCRPLGTVAAS